MKSKTMIVSLSAVFLVVLALGFFACSKPKDSAGPASSTPSDADIIKAIEGSIQMSPVSRLSPVVIEEKGARNPDGSWPVKAKFHGSVFVDYKYRKEVDKEATYLITQSRDKTGKAVWMAAEKQ